MEHDTSPRGEERASDKSRDSPATVQANKQAPAIRKSNLQASQGRHNKWTLWQHWRRASYAKRFKWIVEVISPLIALLILVNYLWQNLQTSSHFQAEHRPRLIFERTPEINGPIECSVTDNAIHVRAQGISVWVKNSGSGPAVDAFIAGPMMKLVPAQRTGVDQIDAPPVINDEMCKSNFLRQMKEFPVGPGGQYRVDSSVLGTQSLIKTSHIGVRLGEGRQPEPTEDPGHPPERVHLGKDAAFNLYSPICVVYKGEDGDRHTTCQNYILVVKRSHVPNVDDRTFSCTESPISGTLIQPLFSYCQN